MPYQRLPIDRTREQIRLLEIAPPSSNASDLICGNLIVVDFQRGPATGYRALSYEWGPADPSFPILINGEVSRVRGNLYKFLKSYQRALFSPPEPPPKAWPLRETFKYIWIDQICIDQRSHSERNHQVHLMSSIFSRAHEVIAWLGIDEPFHNNTDLPLGASIVYQDGPRHVDFPWVGLSYWTRLWVQQELVLAHEVVLCYGRGYISCRQLQYKDAPLCLTRHVKSIHTSHTPLKLWDAITMFSGRGCSDPRDKVFGLLGMVIPEERVEINYSLSAEQVFANALEMVLKKAPSSQFHGDKSFMDMFLSLAYNMGLYEHQSLLHHVHTRKSYKQMRESIRKSIAHSRQTGLLPIEDMEINSRQEFRTLMARIQPNHIH